MNRVLFVDDDVAVLRGLRRMLRSDRRNWDMEFAEGATTALGVMGVQSFDVVVADFRMPGMNGGQFLAEVRHRFPDTARLILTERPEPDDFVGVVGLAHQVIEKTCTSDELHDALARAMSLRDRLGSQRIRAEVSEIGMLPTPSPVFSELMAAIDSPSGDARSVANVINHDMGLTAKVLQLVNSSFFAPRSRVTSVEAAVVRLGREVIRTVAMLDEIRKGFNAPRSVREWCVQLSPHGYEVAGLARFLAPPKMKDDAFCAGLLHECGQLAYARCRPELFGAHLDLRIEQRRGLCDLEREAFGATHAQAGGYLLSLWGFPAEVVEAVALHDADHAPGELARIVQVAHRVIEQTSHSMCDAPAYSRDMSWLVGHPLESSVREWFTESLTHEAEEVLAL